jgi:hypothetical protein
MIDRQALDDADAFFDDDVPSADVNIQRGYEAALGRCMLAFNQLDNLLGKILKTVLARLGRTDMEDDCVNKANFDQRARFLDILKQSTEGAGIIGIPIADLRSVAGERNLLAHAHFEQNPFDGSYWLVNRKGQTEQHYTAERIDGVAHRIQKVWTALRYAEAFYDFADARSAVNPSSNDLP